MDLQTPDIRVLRRNAAPALTATCSYGLDICCSLFEETFTLSHHSNFATLMTWLKDNLLSEVFCDLILPSQARFSVLPWYPYDILEKLINGFACLRLNLAQCAVGLPATPITWCCNELSYLSLWIKDGAPRVSSSSHCASSNQQSGS